MKPRFFFYAYAAAAMALAGDSVAAERNAERQSYDLSSASGHVWEFQPESNSTWDRILVPGGGWRMQGRFCDAGTYRTQIAIPPEALGRSVLLTFDAVNFGAEITAGPDDAHQTFIGWHVNGWLPFSVDLTRAARPGEKTWVLVHVKGRKKFMQKGKYLVPEAASWAEFLAEGILRGVRLELLPTVRIEDVEIRTSVAKEEFSAIVTVVNDTDRPQSAKVAPRFEAGDGFQYPALPAIEKTIPAHERVAIAFDPVKWSLGRKSYWWPNVPYVADFHPVLHRLTVAVSTDGKPSDTITRRFGFREFRAAGAHWELNGVRCNLRGGNQQEANYGPDAYATLPGFGAPTPTCGGWPMAVRNLQRLNFNILRIHQVPATPLMLDVCDELGLMVVDETPIRGSEGAEDYDSGRENMLNCAREQVCRDRHHPSVVLWSAANEINHDALAHALQDTIVATDPTRPVIFDGCKDFGAPLINTEHYVGGIGSFPEKGAKERGDRPFGETEAIWPVDNGPRGFTWMSTATRIRRLKNNADIRDYILNNVWPNYIPGARPDQMFLETKIKKMNWGTGWEIMPAIADPWNHRQIRLMQSSFHPLAAWDVEFAEANQKSNAAGDWPTALILLPAGARIERKLVFFNDTFETGSPLKVTWNCATGTRDGATVASGTLSLPLAPGSHEYRTISFETPRQSGFLWLKLSVQMKDMRFEDDSTCFGIVP